MKNSNIKLNPENFDEVLDNIILDSDSLKSLQSLESVLNSSDLNLNSNSNDSIIEPVKNESNAKNDNFVKIKNELIELNNGWNDKNERIVISIGENASSYKWMHEKTSGEYKLISKILNIIMIILSTGLSAETIIPVDDNNFALSIVRRTLTYMITLLSVLTNFLKYDQLSERHVGTANEFSKLYHDIQQQMCMYRQNRKNATVYVADVLKLYDNLIISGPSIPDNIVLKFKETFKNTDISIPDIADRIQKIEIITENPEIKINMANIDAENITGIKSRGIQTNTDKSKRYGRIGFNNLNEIHNIFRIHGDVTDNDVNNEIELRELKNKFLKEKSDFEYQRYLQHNKETD